MKSNLFTTGSVTELVEVTDGWRDILFLCYLAVNKDVKQKSNM